MYSEAVLNRPVDPLSHANQSDKLRIVAQVMICQKVKGAFKDISSLHADAQFKMENRKKRRMGSLSAQNFLVPTEAEQKKRSISRLGDLPDKTKKSTKKINNSDSISAFEQPCIQLHSTCIREHLKNPTKKTTVYNNNSTSSFCFCKQNIFSSFLFPYSNIFLLHQTLHQLATKKREQAMFCQLRRKEEPTSQLASSPYPSQLEEQRRRSKGLLAAIYRAV